MDDRWNADGPTTTTGDRADATELHRRTSTVLAVRLSTAENVDPERGRSVIAGAVEHLEAAVRRYGGAVVSGPARGELLAVFGFPQTREDDAVCALRAADDFHALMRDDSVSGGTTVAARIGIYTGEVVGAGVDDLYGPPVEHALTLASAAAEGEVLLSETTRRVVGSAATTEKFDDGATWRLVDLAAQPPALEHGGEAPMFGRNRELADALDIFARSATDVTAHLLTVVGDPGLGKSRFAHELVDRVEGGATVLGGRCLAYGEA